MGSKNGTQWVSFDMVIIELAAIIIITMCDSIIISLFT